MKKLILTALVAWATLSATDAIASPHAHNLVGVGGYDLVSYHTGEPAKGSGYHTADHDGVTYLFASEANQKKFKSAPEKYLPAYGGFCAFGAALGKKFAADPETWKIVDGVLYLNLDSSIQQKWSSDMEEYIKKADAQWKDIRDKMPSEL